MQTNIPEWSRYSKTDHDAAFMRIKKDSMGNGQFLPAYNFHIGVADEYIAVAKEIIRGILRSLSLYSSCFEK